MKTDIDKQPQDQRLQLTILQVPNTRTAQHSSATASNCVDAILYNAATWWRQLTSVFHPKSLYALSLCSLLSLLRMTLQFMMMHHYAEFCFKGFSSSEVIIQTNFTEIFNLYLDFKHINPILSLDTLARMMYHQARSTSKRISTYEDITETYFFYVLSVIKLGPCSSKPVLSLTLQLLMMHIPSLVTKGVVLHKTNQKEEEKKHWLKCWTSAMTWNWTKQPSLFSVNFSLPT